MLDIGLLDTGDILKGMRFPYKVSKVIQIVVAAGEISCLVDFYSYTLNAPSMQRDVFLPLP